MKSEDLSIMGTNMLSTHFKHPIRPFVWSYSLIDSRTDGSRQT